MVIWQRAAGLQRVTDERAGGRDVGQEVWI
jgi:hypothetical protein